MIISPTFLSRITFEIFHSGHLIYRLIKSFHSKMAIVAYKIPLFIIKNISLESLILAKRLCEGKIRPKLRKFRTVCPINKSRYEH